MQAVLTAEQMQQLDRYTIDIHGVPSRKLMSRAARRVLAAIQKHWPLAQRLAIFAGPGNNGGDGIALALHALEAGLAPDLFICQPEPGEPPQIAADGAHFMAKLLKLGCTYTHISNSSADIDELVEPAQYDIAVDALFGTGLARPLEPFFQQIADFISRMPELSGEIPRCRVVSIDTPSGLNAATGDPGSGCVRADLTVTIQHRKVGLLHPASMEFCGHIETADIGLADWREAGIHNPAWDGSASIWPVLRHARAPHTHKGDYGKLLIIAGSRRYPGAPRLAANAALRCGSGLTRLLVPESIYHVSCGEPAIMVDAHPATAEGGFAPVLTVSLLEYLSWADAIVIGPGIGSDEATLDFCRQVLAAADKPTVLDADGLRALTPEPAPERRWPLLLTPHAGELGRLSGHTTQEVYDQWFKLSPRIAELHNAFVLAKSNQCVLAVPDGHLFFPSPGHPALAKGGSGDALSGVLGALLARAKAAHERDTEWTHEEFLDQLPLLVMTAVNLLNRAAMAGVKQFGENGLAPSDLPLLLAKVLRRVHEAPAL